MSFPPQGILDVTLYQTDPIFVSWIMFVQDLKLKNLGTLNWLETVKNDFFIFYTIELLHAFFYL